MFKSILFLVFLVIGSSAYAGSWQYLQQHLGAYGDALKNCQQLAQHRPLPPKAIQQQLKQLPARQLTAFLVTQNARAMQICTRSERNGLAYALGLLHTLDLPPTVSQAAQAASKLVFGKVDWKMMQRYRQLPQTLRQGLGSASYFQKPFSETSLRRAIQ